MTEILNNYIERLNIASHNQKGTIVKEACDLLAISKDKFYREIKKLGWSSQRAIRKDAGSTSVSKESLEKMSGMLSVGNRANGKQIVEVPNAISILSANGHDFGSVSNVNRLLRERNATAKQLTAPTAHIQVKSLYPNHVHQVDPSLCIIYYPPDRKKGKVQRFMSDDEFYKNKPANLEKIKNLRVWRYVLTDHCSGTFRFFYYEAAGETTANLYEFLLWCWGLHNDKNCPMRGLPDILYMDKGSANTSKSMVRAIEAGLDVDVLTHEVKRARAKGQVENANNIIEKTFESRLLFEPVSSVAELNQRAIDFQNAYNADKLPAYNAKHNRHKMARYENWMKILKMGKVRDLPDENICRWLLTAKEETRLVKNNLQISFRHPVVGSSCQYDLSGLAGIYAGLKVIVTPMVLSKTGEVIVHCKYNGETQMHQVPPIELDENGFDVNAAVYGQEIKSHKDTAVDDARKAAERVAYPGLSDEEIKKAKRNKKHTPFGGELDAHSHLNNIETPDYMTVRGEQHVTGLEAPTEKTLKGIALKEAVLTKRGKVLTAAESQFLSDLGEVKEHQLDDVIAQLEQLINNSDSQKVVNFKR